MKELGRVLLTEDQGRALADGARLEIPRAQFRASVKKKSFVGDLMWVQEPFYEYMPTQFGSQSVFAIVPGPRFGSKIPAHIGGRAYRRKYRPGNQLSRTYSRATLEITGAIADTAVSCVAHMQQIDVVLRAKEAA